MEFKEGKLSCTWRGVGYVLAYFLFTTVLFFVLKLMNKIPEDWNYLNIMLIVFVIATVGWVVRWSLK